MNPTRSLLFLIRRRFLLLLIVGIFAVGSQVAFAHYVYDEGFTYESTTWPCVENRSEISHGSGYGYAQSKVRSWRVLIPPPPLPHLYCVKSFNRPSNHIKAKVQVVHKPPGASTWQLCYNPALSFNQSTGYILYVSKTFTQSNWCGPGTYGTWAFGYVKNNTWYGGEIWSGTHTLN